ncbi:hypothetical protein [Streptomyces sp. NBC_00094]|uniref:hypothetical protein n=1 Tax=Streptomyces sp. NBC_00094 TaxID=2903620 RepID=UPI00224EAE87|nr:hypothetical protein [Streptomyces sp. NBC_00094]MCX5391529.1 hypothetical protein [Streptomyces sp. NBC_00094]
MERLARRYVDIGNAQRAGHLFEVQHALSFNQNAIRAGASVRAVVTEWAEGGSQTAPAALGPTTHASAVVLPGLKDVRERLAGTDPAAALSGLATLTAAEAGRPVFLTPEEFDAWMASEDAPLVLDPNW